MKLTKSLAAWQSDAFRSVLKTEIEALDAALLPLQQGLAHSSHVSGEDFTAMILDVSEDENVVHAKVGVFYRGVIAGCNCADDPTPLDEQPEYCELLFEIDKTSAETTVRLLAE